MRLNTTCPVGHKKKVKKQLDERHEVHAAWVVFLEYLDHICEPRQSKKLEKTKEPGKFQEAPINTRNTVKVLHWKRTCM